jgi:hypothetical protein
MAAALPLNEVRQNISGIDGTGIRRTLVPAYGFLNGIREPSVPGIFVS